MSAGLSLKPSLETYGNQTCSVRLEGAVVVGGVGRGGRCACNPLSAPRERRRGGAYALTYAHVEAVCSDVSHKLRFRA